MPAAATLPIEKRSLFLQRLAAELERRGYYSSTPCPTVLGLHEVNRPHDKQQSSNEDARVQCDAVAMPYSSGEVVRHEIALALPLLPNWWQCSRQAAPFIPIGPGIRTDSAADRADHPWPKRWHSQVIGKRACVQDCIVMAAHCNAGNRQRAHAVFPHVAKGHHRARVHCFVRRNRTSPNQNTVGIGVI